MSGRAWSRTHQRYQLFSASDDQLYRADVRMDGLFTEHEEESGRVVIHDHQMCAGLAGAEVPSQPFRELWLRDGAQSIDTLTELA